MLPMLLLPLLSESVGPFVTRLEKNKNRVIQIAWGLYYILVIKITLRQNLPHSQVMWIQLVL